MTTLTKKKNQRIAKKVITNGYTDRILRQSQRLTGNQSLLTTYDNDKECGGLTVG